MQKLVSVYRGPLEESSHYGYLVVVNDQGQVVHQLGDPQFETYIRSAAKPLQVIPLLLETLDEKYGFTAEEIAVMCGSHGGEAIHRQAVSSILDKIGLSPEHLLCGIHRPFSPSENRLLRLSGAEPTTLHNNCSGKHAAMLALSVHFNYDTAQYLNPEHPVQKLLLSTVSLFAGIDVDAVHIGVDGCGVPVFGMPLVNMARAYAKLVRPQKLPPGYAQACEKVVTAITANPQMISATHDLDYRLMATNPVWWQKSVQKQFTAWHCPKKV